MNKIKKNILITSSLIFLLLLCGVNLYISLNSSFVGKLKLDNVKYVILGDSITDCGNVTPGVTGGASSPDKGYASLLNGMLQEKYGQKIEFDNRGVGGETVEQARERVDNEILNRDYDLIIVELGTNDWNYGTDLNKFEEDYDNLINTLLNNTEAELVLVGLGWFKDYNAPNSYTDEEEYNKIIQNVAKKNNLMFIDVWSAMKNSGYPWETIVMTEDPVHPNDLGHKIWADEVYSSLIKIK